MIRRPTLTERILSAIGWWLRGIAAVMLMGCATTPPRKPCTYTVTTTLTEDADGECHKLRLRDHKGNRLNGTSEVYGCGDSRGIISNGTRSNVGHENGHAIEDLCPEWAKGYFD